MAYDHQQVRVGWAKHHIRELMARLLLACEALECTPADVQVDDLGTEEAKRLREIADHDFVSLLGTDGGWRLPRGRPRKGAVGSKRQIQARLRSRQRYHAKKQVRQAGVP